jgi:hypothetical protein
MIEFALTFDPEKPHTLPMLQDLEVLEQIAIAKKEQLVGVHKKVLVAARKYFDLEADVVLPPPEPNTAHLEDPYADSDDDFGYQY